MAGWGGQGDGWRESSLSPTSHEASVYLIHPFPHLCASLPHVPKNMSYC